ncbi:MAG: cyclic nucleotide-binding domain-containing protein, partial [Planktomarina sp.]|nr:cyclic nucleotide-binding domain-containing protein [Planktomarina sp.]
MADKSFTNGEYIFREGESAAYAYVIKSGTVEITKHSTAGEQVLAELAAPTIFGEMALIDGNPRSAGARANTDTVVTEVTADAFVKYLKQNPEAGVRIMKNISNNLRTSNQLVAKYERAGAGDESSTPIQVFTEHASDDFEIDDTDAIYDQGPSKPLLIIALTLLTFFIGSVVFASLSQVATTISARGEFLTATPNVIVEASASSVVKSVEVRRGDAVVKGQIIAYLDDTVVSVNLKQNQEKIDNIYQSLVGLHMEQMLIDDIQQFNSKLNLNSFYEATIKKLNLENNSEKFNELYSVTLTKKVLEYSEKIKSFNSKLDTARNEYESSKELLEISKKQTGIKAQLARAKKELFDRQSGTLSDILTKQTEIKVKQAAVQKDLYERQVISLSQYLTAKDTLLNAEKTEFNSKTSTTKMELDYLSAKDALLNAEKAQFNAKTAILKLESAITTQTADKQAFIASWTSKLTGEISAKNEELTQLKQEKIKLSRLVDNIIVKSPAEGIVLDIPAVARGGIVSEGEAIVTLVQSNQPLFLEVDIDPKKITDMKLGMEVSVKLDAMPFQEFGGLDGELIYVSNDTFNESVSGDKGVFYRGRVKIESLKGSDMPSDFILSQGMMATADILVGQRPLISYFTYPILNAFEDSFKEPE